MDDDLANEVAPGAGGAEGLRTQLLKMQREKMAQDTGEAVNEALMAAVVESAAADIPQHFTEEMGRQEYQARLLAAVARVCHPGPFSPHSLSWGQNFYHTELLLLALNSSQILKCNMQSLTRELHDQFFISV